MVLCVFAAALCGPARGAEESKMMAWSPLPDLPDKLGVAGPFVGVHHDALIVAGGANFPTAAGGDLWQADKVWHDEAYVLVRDGKDGYTWLTGFKLDRPVAYGACVSTERGVVCMGGNDAKGVFSRCFLLKWDADTRTLTQSPLPDLPEPCAFGAAARIGDTIYLAGGQNGASLETAMSNFWALHLTKDGADPWEKLPAWPGQSRAFNLTLAQHNGFDDCIYVMSGRRQKEGVSGVDGMDPLRDVYEFNPKTRAWRKRSDVPVCVMAGTGAAVGQSHLFVLSGADGSLFAKADELKDAHPGFPKRAWAYHTITDTWIDAGTTPMNQVTTPAVKWDGAMVIAAGEVRPRVRSSEVWRILPLEHGVAFGPINFAVLIVYLLAMVGVGVYFANKNTDTDDYFRGGQRIPWWVAGCSIFATMLSSITYMAVPATAYAQNWVLIVANFMIPAVAPLAVYVALPFFRRIDATSAYEYLSKRFNLPVRLFGSGLFTVFHIFRMGIVMSLAALALASVTPLSPVQGLLIMGLLSIIYCTLGGIEAVVWTDTIQTFVLLGGAMVCFVLVIIDIDGGLGRFFDIAMTDHKMHMVNFDFSETSYMTMAIWVVVLGGLGQNVSSYVADQAVVQRYMTTSDADTAARSIWMNAALTIPASFLFFGMGTALYVYYKLHPQQLDPTINTDQIFPLFISTRLPVGAAGLIVAGIFAAAQSTISTSMNSTATTLVTDFMRPFNLCRTERGYLNAGRTLTLALGVAGTIIGLLFVDASNRLRFASFLWIIGLFMGVLGGLFCLGILTRRANGLGAFIGVVSGVAAIIALNLYSHIHWYLYAPVGIVICFSIGYLASIVMPASPKNIDGLTIYTMRQPVASNASAPAATTVE
ncbi:MAG: sodium/solute symporter [Planctomycetes bacterium]|nr:sodium/solute symporter [Planctomycetota bacterium]